MSHAPTRQAADAPSRPKLTPVLFAALTGGLIAGTLDIFAASLINRLPPAVILRAVASGIWGREAFTGPGWMVQAGLALQWAMSIVIAAVYALAAVRLSPLARRPTLWGLAYGVGVFAVMDFVVVPLSRAVAHPHPTRLWLAENLLAMLVFGLITAWITGVFLRLKAR